MIYPGNYFITNIHKTSSSQNLASWPTTNQFIIYYGSWGHFKDIEWEYSQLKHLNPRIVHNIYDTKHKIYNNKFKWNSLFEYACYYNEIKVLKVFCKEKGASINLPCEFDTICMHGNIESIELIHNLCLNGRGWDPNRKCTHEEHIEHFPWICEYLDKKYVKYFLKKWDLPQRLIDRGFCQATRELNITNIAFLSNHISIDFPEFFRGGTFAIIINNPRFYHRINDKEYYYMFLKFLKKDFEFEDKDEKIYNMIINHPKYDIIKQMMYKSSVNLHDLAECCCYEEIYDDETDSFTYDIDLDCKEKTKYYLELYKEWP